MMGKFTPLSKNLQINICKRPQPALRNATSSNIAAVGGQRPTAAIFELVAFLRAACDMTIINKGTRYYKDNALSRGPCLVWP